MAVTCPAMVHEYNQQMGGVDLMDMYLSLYRIRVQCKKNYHYIFHYLLQVSVINSWLLYRRYRHAPKRQRLSLLDFTMDVSDSLMRAGKQPISQPKRGRPPLTQEGSFKSPATASPAKRPYPNASIRVDSIGHFSPFVSNQEKCAKPGYTHIECSNCAVSLCLVKDCNCFTNFPLK